MGPRGQGSGRIASHKPIHHYWASPRNGSVCTAPGLLICPDCISNTLCFAEGDSLLTYDWGVNTKKMRGTGMLWCLRLGWNLLGYCSSRPKCLLWPLGRMYTNLPSPTEVANLGVYSNADAFPASARASE